MHHHIQSYIYQYKSHFTKSYKHDNAIMDDDNSITPGNMPYQYPTHLLMPQTTNFLAINKDDNEIMSTIVYEQGDTLEYKQ